MKMQETFSKSFDFGFPNFYFLKISGQNLTKYLSILILTLSFRLC